MGEIILQVSGLNKVYKSGKLAVKDVTFNLTKGDVFGFLGPNGAGKTTTIRMLLGLIKPTKGKIIIHGKEMNHKNKYEVLDQIGALVEGPAFYEYLDAIENLKIFASYSGMNDYKHIEKIIELVGLKGREKDLVKHYSLGMKQRLGIAQALLNHPEILILDEPTNGLDPQGIKEIRELIIRLGKEGITIIVASHILDEIQKMCNRLIVLNEGEVILQGTTEELLCEKESHYIIRSKKVEDLKRVLKTWKAVELVDEQEDVLGKDCVKINLKHTKPEVVFEYLANKSLDIIEYYQIKKDLETMFFKVVGEEHDGTHTQRIV